MARTRDNLTLAWERNEAAVRLRYPDLTTSDLRALERLRAIPLATGEVIPGPETLLELYRIRIGKGKANVSDTEMPPSEKPGGKQ